MMYTLYFITIRVLICIRLTGSLNQTAATLLVLKLARAVVDLTTQTQRQSRDSRETDAYQIIRPMFLQLQDACRRRFVQGERGRSVFAGELIVFAGKFQFIIRC